MRFFPDKSIARIVISQDRQEMLIYEGTEVVRRLPVSTGWPGMRKTQTPTWIGKVGRFWGTFTSFGTTQDLGYWLFTDKLPDGSWNGDILIHGAPYTLDEQGNKIGQVLAPFSGKSVAWNGGYGCLPGTFRVAGILQYRGRPQPADAALRYYRDGTLIHIYGDFTQTGDFFPSLQQLAGTVWQQIAAGGPDAARAPAGIPLADRGAGPFGRPTRLAGRAPWGPPDAHRVE